MWIVKNSTSLLSSLDQLDVCIATSVQTYDFSTLYTSISHSLLKFRITSLAHNSFKRRDESNRYAQIKITSGKGAINPGGDNLCNADQVSRMIEFFIDNTFVKFGGCHFHQVIGIPMGTNGDFSSLFSAKGLYLQTRPKLMKQRHGARAGAAKLINHAV